MTVEGRRGDPFDVCGNWAARLGTIPSGSRKQFAPWAGAGAFATIGRERCRAPLANWPATYWFRAASRSCKGSEDGHRSSTLTASRLGHASGYLNYLDGFDIDVFLRMEGRDCLACGVSVRRVSLSVSAASPSFNAEVGRRSPR
jgi:hypothetical protein